MRVLAVTGNASLVVALGSMMREWEVVNVRNADEATRSAQGAAVALIDMADTDLGLQVADQLYNTGITLPCVIIGDHAVEHPRASVIVRPFSLEDLGGAVKAAAENKPGGNQETTRRIVSEPPAVEPTPKPSSSSPSRAAGSAATAPQEEREEQPKPARRGSLSVVRPEPEVDEEMEEPVVEEAPPAADERRGTTADIMREQLEQIPLPPEPVHTEPAAEPPAPVSPPAASTPAYTETFPETPAAEVEQPGRRRLRRKAQSRTPAPEVPTEDPFVRRLKAAASFALEFESLLNELPVLKDLHSLAEALVEELTSQFAAQVASVFVAGPDGYTAVAHHGLSRVEAGMVVLETQPLFSDVLQTREGVLIQPVDLAQGLVAGIGGARTEAMMVCPVAFGDAVVAIVVIGGDRFAEADLDRLGDLAAEAAPGLAVALGVHRIRGA